MATMTDAELLAALRDYRDRHVRAHQERAEHLHVLISLRDLEDWIDAVVARDAPARRFLDEWRAGDGADAGTCDAADALAAALGDAPEAPEVPGREAGR